MAATPARNGNSDSSDSAAILTQVVAYTKVGVASASFNAFPGISTACMMSGKEKMQTSSASSYYVAFLIRCWREGNSWHFMLETIGKTRGQQHGFVGYEQLSLFLKQQFIEQDGDPDSNHQGGSVKK